jgi:hypothetical protein
MKTQLNYTAIEKAEEEGKDDRNSNIMRSSVACGAAEYLRRLLAQWHRIWGTRRMCGVARR